MNHVPSIGARVCAGALALAFSGGGALLLAAPANAAGVADQLALSGSANKPDVARADKLIRCTVIEQQRFCTEIGFVRTDNTSASWKSFLADALEAGAPGDGDLSLADQLSQIEALTSSALAQRQNEQIAEARQAAARMTLVDAITYGTALPAGFFSSHPELGIAEGSVDAAVFRAQAVNPSEMALTERLAKAGFGAVDEEPGRVTLSTPRMKTTSASDSTLLSSQAAVSTLSVNIPSSRYIIGSYFSEQEKSYYCGVATMQSIDWADDGGKDSQATWASLLGTTTNGTAITSIVSLTNSKTNWDSLNTGGTYATISAANRSIDWFRNIHDIRIGYYGAPVVEHVQLRKVYFDYLKYDHGGHFQTGRGYAHSTDTVSYFEPYDERDWSSGGNATAGIRSRPFTKMWDATLANSNRNIGA